jgi:hypothetical protein
MPLIHWINSPDPRFSDFMLINAAAWMAIGFAVIA